ncbi:NAD or nadp-dependent reductase [Reticulomyxa filosa]|uniref:NADPH--hemoprotein reductase n=1 Tax=Reticulomyxa filosa TaxID=46433 RepID=X6MM93_RETFI|nr:NAD or nadp-dependent reductase [Reticulomyxa filosa]|eukprot:ETO14557.1 NAD or nadp-dependent reductase [Reticulomyxa filosa]
MSKEAKKFGFKATVVDLEDYDLSEITNEKLVIFLVATYGEGEPTDNAQEFYQWLISDERMEGELQQIEFAVFGLGNSQYEFFNEMGKQFDYELHKLGGHRLLDRGVGDDDKGSIEDQFNDWKQVLWPILTMKYLGISVDESSADLQTFVNSLQIFSVSTDQEEMMMTKKKEEEKHDNDEGKEKNNTQWATFDRDYDTHWLYGQMALRIHNPFSEAELRSVVSETKAKFKNCYAEDVRINPNLLLPYRRHHWMEQVTKALITDIHEARPRADDGSTLHVEFDITQLKSSNGLHFNYKTADNLGIVPKNDLKAVQFLCQRLRANPDDVIRIRNKNQEPLNIAIPSIVSIRNLLLWYLDINGIPKRQTLQVMAQFALDEREKAQLQDMASKTLATDQPTIWNFVSLLRAFPSVAIDLATTVEILRPLQPRYYTIASSNKAQPNRIAITAKMEMQLADSEDLTFIGVTSNYLRQSKVNDAMQIFVQPSSFRLPLPKIPVIMVGVGAGIAPFRGFLQEGNHLISSGQYTIQEGTFADWWLFFGCRYPDRDYVYKEFLESSLHANGGCLKQLKVAFSREKSHKVYVQDLIKENSDALYDLLINKNAQVFVCGQPAMGKAVRAVFQEVIDSHQKHVDINTWLKSGKYVQELW